MTEGEERAFALGQRAAGMNTLRSILSTLGIEERSFAALVLEREEAIMALREVCAEYGDNDWKPSTHLGDIIAKHLHLPLRMKENE